MISPKVFYEGLNKISISFFTGVPDSLLKDFLAYMDENTSDELHITAANEGAAVGIAAGYNLATGQVAAIYLQNSGLGNAINPLISLADREVYSIPMLVIVGWRGEPGGKDEPQHVKQGKITEDLVRVMDMPYVVLSPEMSADEILNEAKKLVEVAKEKSCPAFLLVKSRVFEEYKAVKRSFPQDLMTREEAIDTIIECLPSDAVVISTTGKISRELYEIRNRRGEKGRDFLTVGSMGHASQIALGIALQKKSRPIYCLDGDGATIMHMGSLATIGWVKPANLRHIVLDNQAHESVGGQRSAAESADLVVVARGCGYLVAEKVSSKAELRDQLKNLETSNGPAFLEVLVNLESRKDLGRPKETPLENKQDFIDFMARKKEHNEKTD